MAQKYTDKEKMVEAQREVRMRESVYERQVLYRRMTQEEADRRLGIMREIADDYQTAIKAQEKNDQLQF